MAKESPLTDSMKVKKILVGITIGLFVGLVLECLKTLWMSWRPWTQFSSIFISLPLGTLVAVAGIIGCCIGIGAAIREYTRRCLVSKFEHLPICAADFIMLVIKKMRYRRKVQADVQAELADHFEDELKDCKSDEEKEQKAQQLIADFGDVKLLAVLLRRAKKRCRPLWRTIAARTFQTAGIIIVCFILYVVWFLSGKPVITTDYVAELNRIVRPAADENLNAAPLYVEAAELIDKLPDETKELLSKKYNEVTSEQKLLIEKWLNENKEILELVIAGSKKPYYWPKYETGEENTGEMMAVLLPHLSDFRRLTRALRLQAHLRAEQGRYEDAFDDIKACYRFGRHIKGDKFLIEQLVGIAFESLAVRTLRSILSEHKIDSATLVELQQDFERMIADEDFTVSFKFEKLCMYDEIQRCFTKGRLGEGHLYLPRLIRIGEDWGEVEPGYEIPLMIYGAVLSPENWSRAAKVLFIHPNKRESREMADGLYDYWGQIAHKSPAQIRAENIDVEEQTIELVKGNILLEILTPAIGRVCEIAYRNKIDVEATLTVIAILRYKEDTGDYPENLNEMVTAGYLKDLPIDPWSDKPLVYKKTDDGFLLYSFGLNFTDDGGQVHRDDKGRVRPWGDEGDAVFWPVRK